MTLDQLKTYDDWHVFRKEHEYEPVSTTVAGGVIIVRFEEYTGVSPVKVSIMPEMTLVEGGGCKAIIACPELD